VAVTLNVCSRSFEVIVRKTRRKYRQRIYTLAQCTQQYKLGIIRPVYFLALQSLGPKVAATPGCFCAKIINIQLVKKYKFQVDRWILTLNPLSAPQCSIVLFSDQQLSYVCQIIPKYILYNLPTQNTMNCILRQDPQCRRKFATRGF